MRRAFLNNFAADQERSARFLYAHRLDRRDLFITEDVVCFGEPGSDKRRKLSALADTAILSLEEFKRWCNEHRTK